MAASNVFYILRNGIGQGFFIPKAPLTEHNIPDQTSRVFLITGGYTGIGLEVASILYGANGTVWLAGRSETKATSAIERITSTHPNSKGHLHFLKLDLSDLTTIAPAAADFRRRNATPEGGNGKLHWLNNNAGVMFPPKGSKGAQGYDLQLVTNIYSPFLLTKLLLPVLRSTAASDTNANVRVSWAGSAASFMSPPRGGVAWNPDGKDLKDAYEDPQAVYGITKAANWWLANEFGARYGDADGVLHNAYNPGNLVSELQRTTAEVMGRVMHWIIVNLLCYPVINGAYTELYAGLSPELTLKGGDQGAWIVPWGRKSEMRKDFLEERRKGKDGLGAKVWEWCEGIVREYEK